MAEQGVQPRENLSLGPRPVSIPTNSLGVGSTTGLRVSTMAWIARPQSASLSWAEAMGTRPATAASSLGALARGAGVAAQARHTDFLLLALEWNALHRKAFERTSEQLRVQSTPS